MKPKQLLEITLGEKTTDQSGRVVERVSAQALLPYIHQRYDDPQQVLDAPPEGTLREEPEGAPREEGA